MGLTPLLPRTSGPFGPGPILAGAGLHPRVASATGLLGGPLTLLPLALTPNALFCALLHALHAARSLVPGLTARLPLAGGPIGPAPFVARAALVARITPAAPLDGRPYAPVDNAAPLCAHLAVVAIFILLALRYARGVPADIRWVAVIVRHALWHRVGGVQGVGRHIGIHPSIVLNGYTLVFRAHLVRRAVTVFATLGHALAIHTALADLTIRVQCALVGYVGGTPHVRVVVVFDAGSVNTGLSPHTIPVIHAGRFAQTPDANHRVGTIGAQSAFVFLAGAARRGLVRARYKRDRKQESREGESQWY